MAAAAGAPRAALAALLTDTGNGTGMTQAIKWAVKFHRVRAGSMVEGAVLWGAAAASSSLLGRAWWHWAALRAQKVHPRCPGPCRLLARRHQPSATSHQPPA